MNDAQCVTELRGELVVCIHCGLSLPAKIVGHRFTANCRNRPPRQPLADSELAARAAACAACQFFKPDRGTAEPICVLLACQCNENASNEEKAARLVIRWREHLASGSAECLLPNGQKRWRAAP